MQEYSGILATYKRMRSVGQEMNSALAGLCSPFIKEAAKDLGVWKSGAIVLDIDEMPVLMDHAIHRCPQRGRYIPEIYAAEHPPVHGSDAEAVLHATQQAFFSLFQVREVVKGIGARVFDSIRGQEHLLVDVNLARTAVKNMVVASTALPFEGFIMTGGAALLVDREVLQWVVEGLDNDGFSYERMRNQSKEAWNKFATEVMRRCLHSKASRQIRYGDVPAGDGTPELAKAAGKVGRNDPCPCGSGKKYKKCCG